MGNVHEVTDATFESEVIKSDRPVLVDFWAAWCGPCRMVAPIVEELAGEMSERLKVTKVDVDANQAVAARFGVMSIPTLMVFKNGEPTGRIVGYQPKPALKSKVEAAIA
jgi:thioredoxin 1